MEPDDQEIEARPARGGGGTARDEAQGWSERLPRRRLPPGVGQVAREDHEPGGRRAAARAGVLQRQGVRGARVGRRRAGAQVQGGVSQLSARGWRSRGRGSRSRAGARDRRARGLLRHPPRRGGRRGECRAPVRGPSPPCRRDRRPPGPLASRHPASRGFAPRGTGRTRRASSCETTPTASASADSNPFRRPSACTTTPRARLATASTSARAWATSWTATPSTPWASTPPPRASRR